MSNGESFTAQDLLAQVESRIEELSKSDKMKLSDGWTTSIHYQEGYYAGQFALLIEIRNALNDIQ